ncbi:hypothetical protein ACLB1Q_06615 [Escherichia coli]
MTYAEAALIRKSMESSRAWTHWNSGTKRGRMPKSRRKKRPKKRPKPDEAAEEQRKADEAAAKEAEEKAKADEGQRRR